MNQRQFNRLALEIAQAEHPQYRWWLQADRLAAEPLPPTEPEPGPQLEIDGASFNLASMCARAPHSGDLRGWIRERLISNLQIMAEYTFGDWSAEAANLRPLLKSLDFLLGTEQGRAAGERGVPVCVFPWLGPLCVACVLDRPTIMGHISQGHLDKWQVSPEQVFEQAQANLASQVEVLIRVDDVAGFKIALTEPAPYAATMAILPGFRQVLGRLLGPRYRIMLATENLLSAYASTSANYDPAHEDALARDLLDYFTSFGDPGKPLPYTGHLAVDLDAGTLRWEPNDAALDPDIERDAERLVRNIEREHRQPAKQGLPQPPTRRRYTQ